MSDQTEEQRQKLQGVIERLEAQASKVGPLHGWWDVIFDMKAFLRGEPTVATNTADGWISYGKWLLAETGAE